MIKILKSNIWSQKSQQQMSLLSKSLNPYPWTWIAISDSHCCQIAGWGAGVELCWDLDSYSKWIIQHYVLAIWHMPCPFTGLKTFWAGPNFLCQTKNWLTFCTCPKTFLCQTNRWFPFSKFSFCASTKFLGVAQNAI